MLAIFVSEFKKTQQRNIFRNSLYAKFCSVSLQSHIQNLQGTFMSEFPEIISIVLSFITNSNSFFPPSSSEFFANCTKHLTQKMKNVRSYSLLTMITDFLNSSKLSFQFNTFFFNFFFLFSRTPRKQFG